MVVVALAVALPVLLDGVVAATFLYLYTTLRTYGVENNRVVSP